jgi:hypothetical protein
MNRKYTLVILISTIMIVGCKSESKQNSEEIQKKEEITNVISYFEKTMPIDGSFDSEEDYNSTKEVVELQTVKNNTINWCYDTQDLLKIEILGYLTNATIIYKNSSDSEILLLNDANIEGSYSIVPSESNSISGGKIIIKSGDKILKEIVVNYEGCL